MRLCCKLASFKRLGSFVMNLDVDCPACYRTENVSLKYYSSVLETFSKDVSFLLFFYKISLGYLRVVLKGILFFFSSSALLLASRLIS